MSDWVDSANSISPRLSPIRGIQRLLSAQKPSGCSWPVTAICLTCFNSRATDVVAKKPKKVKATPKPAQARKVATKSALSPNTQKLWTHLKPLLNAKKFTEIKRSQVGVAAGLPLGSVTASFNKLIENAYLEENASGALKLISKK